MLPSLLLKVKRLDRNSSSSAQTSGQMVDNLSNSLGNISNPYTNYNYENGLWDKMGDFFGFRTNQDKFREEMLLKANEFNSQLQLAQAQNEYNSPTAQVNRARAAGINPELAGVENISSATPAGIDSSGLSSALDPTNNSSTAFSLASAALSAFQGCVGVISSIESLKGMSIQNDLGEFDFIQKIYGAGRNYAEQSYLPEGRNHGSPEAYMNYLDLFGLRNSRNSKLRFNAFTQGFNDMMTGAIGRTKLADVRFQDAKAKLQENSLERSGIESESFINDFSEYAGKYLKSLQYETAKLEFLKAKAQASTAQNEISYNEKSAELGLPSAEAEAGKADAELAKAVAKIQQKITAESSSIVNDAFKKSPLLGFLTQLFVGDVTKPFQSSASSIAGTAAKVVTKGKSTYNTNIYNK